jgi:hypothetical protein
VAKEVTRQLALGGSARSGGSGSEIFYASGPAQRIEPLLIALWAPQVRLQRLPKFQALAGGDLNATP